MDEFQKKSAPDAEQPEKNTSHEQLEKDASEAEAVTEQVAETAENTAVTVEETAQVSVEKSEPTETPQPAPKAPFYDKKNVFHDFPKYFYAGFWIRFCSFIVDLWCISAIKNVTIGFVFKLAGWEQGDSFLSPYRLAGLAVYLAYFILLTKLNHGQTIGKMIFGLKVVCFSEEELSWQTVIIREGFCRFLLQWNFLTYIGYLFAGFSENKQHLGDLFTDTSVVTLNTLKAYQGETA